MRIIGRGENPSPFGRLRSLTGGNRTAAIFVYGAAALRVPPPEILHCSVNTPPPAVLGGVRATPAGHSRSRPCESFYVLRKTRAKFLRAT